MLQSKDAVEEKSLSTCAETTHENSTPESLPLNKCNCRGKKICDCKSSMTFACRHVTKQFEVTKLNCVHDGHPAFGVIQDKIPKIVKHKDREQLNLDGQSPSSVLLSMERKCNLNISSKEICNLKDRDMGEKSKHFYIQMKILIKCFVIVLF